jgi:hypothetical protein
LAYEIRERSDSEFLEVLLLRDVTINEVQAVAEEKPVAAQLGGVTILAKAGILKGKKYAFASDPLKTTPRRKIIDPNFTGAIYSGRGVVQDGNIITSGMWLWAQKYSAFQMELPNSPRLLLLSLRRNNSTFFCQTGRVIWPCLFLRNVHILCIPFKRRNFRILL